MSLEAAFTKVDDSVMTREEEDQCVEAKEVETESKDFPKTQRKPKKYWTNN